MKGWTSEAIKRTNLPTKSTLVGKSVLPPQIPRGLAFIVAYLSTMEIDFIPEFKFHEKRKFRFDIAIPKMMIAVEYEGLMSEKSGHTTLTGYSSNCEKYNLAAVNGWIVLRYTCQNYENFIQDFTTLKNLKC